MARFFGGCLWPATFLNRNDSQAQLARWKWPATAMFNDAAVDRGSGETAGKCSRDRISQRLLTERLRYAGDGVLQFQ
jgi:hypothetical protein